MIKKYYVTSADLNTVTHAHSGPQAIFIAFDRMGKQKVNQLNSIIRVSEIGHGEHSDDELFLLADMFTLWILNKNWDGVIDGLSE